MSVVPPRPALEALAARLGGGAPGASDLAVVVEGVRVRISFALRASGSSSMKWTELSVAAKDVAATPLKLLLDVRPTQSFDAAHVRAGRLIDLAFDDPVFDHAFNVEAAPADVVRILLSAPIRAEMLALSPLRLFSTADSFFEIEREGWLEDIAVLERLTRLIARLGASLATATNEATAARRVAPHEGGYRVGPPTTEEIQRERDIEVAAVEAQRARRLRRTRRLAIGFAVGVIVALAAGAIALATCG